jgi:cytochrome c-type biogenesis protein
MADPTIPIAFFAGLVSFLSPCVLPLVPGYLSYMSGIPGGEEEESRPGRMVVVALAFVLGFSVVFVGLGATATWVGSFLVSRQTLLTRIGGVFVIAMGLVFLGVIKVPWLYREARFHPTTKAGVWGSALLGSTFAFGWSPCIGPTMGAALTMAAGNGVNGGPAEGAMLLGFYSLGLGLPFILAGVGISRLAGAVKWLRGHARTINYAGGALLIVIGLLLVTDKMFELSGWMQEAFTDANLDFWNEF